jgi:hypothetical protein
MNTFNKKSLCVALAATGLLGVGGVAQAVNLSEDGTGMVLVYPYYTVRAPGAGTNPYNTYINVTNTTASAKAVKIRFREGKNSREVLDFNIFLSPLDMWTGAVIPTAAGGAAIVTADRSCTIPDFGIAASAPLGTVSAPVAFKSSAYAGDGGGDTVDRTREGYVEIFEMAAYPAATTVAQSVLHSSSTGLPAACGALTEGPTGNTSVEGAAPSGGLFGTLQLINPGAGASMSVNAVALDNFYTLPPGVNIYRSTASAQPNMADAGTTSAVKAGNNLTVTTGWGAGTANSASAVLMHDSIMNEFFQDSAALSVTDWVVTFPTKNFYVDKAAPVLPPFQRLWDTATGKSCDDVTFGLRDREERIRLQSVSGPGFSPPDAGPIINVPTLCYEANVVTFDGGAILGSKNTSLNIQTLVGAPPGTPAGSGWASIVFDRFGAVGGPGVLVGGNTVQTPLATGVSGAANPTSTYTGLPVVGFNVWKYTNSALSVGGVVSNVPTNYGMGVPHKSRTTIVTP